MPNTITPRYYPRLSEVITLDKIPDELSFVRDSLTAVFDKIHFKNLQYSVSQNRDSAFYSLDIVTRRRLGITLPGDLVLVLNPDQDGDVGISSFPISLEYQWEILAYLKSFDLASFDYFDPSKYYELGLKVFRITDDQATAHILNFFVEQDVNVPNKYQQVLNDVNEAYNRQGTDVLAFAAGEEPSLSSLTTLLGTVAAIAPETEPPTASDVLFYTYVLVMDEELSTAVNLEQTFTNLKRFYKRIIPQDFEAFIRKLIVPRVKASFELSAGLEVPRTYLVPVYGPDGENPFGDVPPLPSAAQKEERALTVIEGDAQGYPRFMMNFGEMTFTFDTVEGIGYQADLGLSTSSYAQIGNTGFIINIQDLKVDLSEKRNIQEANTDNRPKTFKGIYLEEVDIIFPPEWKEVSGTVRGKKLLIGTEGGLSGTLELETSSLTAQLFGMELSLTTFSVDFYHNKPISSSIIGTLTIENEVLTIEGTFTSVDATDPEEQFDGFIFRVTTDASGASFAINDQLKATLKSFTFIRNNTTESYSIGISGGLQLKDSSLPIIGDLIPEEIVLNKLLFNSKEGIEDFDIKVTWRGDDRSKAVVLQTTDSETTLTVPVNKTIADTLLISVIKAKLKNVTVPSGNKTTELQVLMNGELHLGIVDAEIVGFGVKTNVAFDRENAETEGRLGPLAFTATTMVLPNGIGISIDSNGITGKGFLNLDPENGEFSGDLFLEVYEKFSVRATGILVTKLPNGEKGFSLIVIINFIFPAPVQIGFGFTMKGIGGILGVHRRAETDLLAANVKTGKVGEIMFPDADISSDELLTNLRQFFPVATDRHLIGFMGKFGYSSFLTGDVGLIVEVPSPIRILILGSIRATFPKDAAAGDELVIIKVDFLGIIEFDPFYLSFDASLNDSYIGRYPLYGDLALRIIGGDRPNFVFTAGGYHPDYSPPPQTPSTGSMRRLELNLSTGDSLTVNATSYFAITSNSVQFGAAVHAAAKLGKAGVSGSFSLDVLFYFKPFYFRMDAHIDFAITWKGESILQVKADLTLTGPNYWNVNGTVTFSILKFDVSISLNKTWGDAPPAELPENRSVLADLIAELSESRSWTTDFTNQDNLVTFRELEGEQGILVGPTGKLKVNQRVTPLNYTLTKYGSAKPTENPAHFKFTKIKIGNAEVENITYFKDFFAPSLFRQIDGIDQVKTAPFEKFDSGVEISALFDTVGGQHRVREMEYDRLVIDFNANAPTDHYDPIFETRSTHQDSREMAYGFAADGPGGNSGLSADATPGEKFISMADEGYQVVFADDLEPMTPVKIYQSRMQALQAIDQVIASDPTFEGRLQVVSEYEMA